MNRLEDLYKHIKKEYCNLFDYKIHGNGRTLEIIAPSITITDKFASVFLTIRDGKFIITDGGWLDNNIYEGDYFDEDSKITENLITQYLNYYEIKTTFAPTKLRVFYKEVKKSELIPSTVFDLANFISGVVNIHSLELREKKGKEERDRFKSNTNEYLKEKYDEKFNARYEVGGVTFNAVIKERSKLHLIEYVTGHTKQYFENDLRKAAVNFDIITDSNFKNHIGEKIAILNDNSLGYEFGPSSLLVKYLEKNLTKNYLTWKDRNKILEIINPN